MAIIKSIYGNEDRFISLPDAVRWIASNYGLSEHLSSQITRQKILSGGKNIYVYVDLYGKIIDESNDVEFYLVANQNKIYYKHELEYVYQLFEYLSEYGSYKAPAEEDLKFFYYNYYIKKDDLYSFFNVSEKETENLKKPEPPTENYNPTERETHLQIIAIQSFELAKLKSSYLTGTGKVRQSTIATTLEKEAKELFANPKSSDTYRKRIAEALKTYETQAE